MQALEKGQDLVLGLAVECGERFVHEEQLRLREQRTADGDALALSTGEVARRPVEELRQAEQVDHLVECDPALGRRAFLRCPEEQVAPHREMREQARFLKDVADRPLMRRFEGRSVLPDVAVDRAIAVTQALQTRDAAQDRGLAAAGRSEKTGHACRRYRKGGVELESPERAAEGGADRLSALIRLARATRLSIRVIARMTAKAKTTMPAGEDARLEPTGRLDEIVDGNRQHLGLARYVAADHQDDAELSYRMSKAEHGARHETRTRERHRDRPERFAR